MSYLIDASHVHRTHFLDVALNVKNHTLYITFLNADQASRFKPCNEGARLITDKKGLESTADVQGTKLDDGFLGTSVNENDDFIICFSTSVAAEGWQKQLPVLSKLCSCPLPIRTNTTWNAKAQRQVPLSGKGAPRNGAGGPEGAHTAGAAKSERPKTAVAIRRRWWYNELEAAMTKYLEKEKGSNEKPN